MSVVIGERILTRDEDSCTFRIHGRVKFEINQGSSIFKTILQPLFNLRVLIQKTYLNTSGKNGHKWRSQCKNGGKCLPIHQ